MIFIRFWFWKILIILGICIGAFFIPNQGFAPSKEFVNKKMNC
jgi:predicted membrane metal-binding protein